jgi:hypothetical protein
MSKEPIRAAYGIQMSFEVVIVCQRAQYVRAAYEQRDDKVKKHLGQAVSQPELRVLGYRLT